MAKKKQEEITNGQGHLELDDKPPDEENQPKPKSKCASCLTINKKLIPLKILMLLMHGGMAALYPYLTVHMRSIGLSFIEIGIIYAILPFVSAIGPAIGGAIADKMGNYKIVLIVCILMSVLSHMLLWFAVPVLTPSVTFSHSQITTLTANFPCGPVEIPHYLETDASTFGCGVMQNDATITLQNCSSDCKNVQRFPPNICLSGQNSNDCFIWRDLSLRFFSNVKFKNNSTTNTSLAMESFLDETGRNVTWITCLHKTSCTLRCRAETNITLRCNETTASSNRIKPLALYVTFRYLAGIFVSTVIPVLDAVAYQMSEDYEGDLGIQRMFSLFGLCAIPPLSGFLVGIASKHNGFADYSPAFYIFGGMNLLSVLVLLCMSLRIRVPAADIMKNVGNILRNPKAFVFILMMFLAGCAWGFLENYLFPFMEDLGSPKWLFGMTNTVSGLSAIPVVAASTLIMRYLGHTKILMLCFIFYGIRFLSYAYIYNPFHILPVEVLEAITTSLLWVVASVYCGKIAPEYLATLQGIIGVMHYALGRGVGSLLGGLMFSYFKPRLTYLIFGGSCIGIGVVYALLHFAWLRKIPNVQKEEKEPTIMTAEEALVTLPSLGHRLSKKEEKDVVDQAKFEAFMPLAMTFSGGRSLSLRSSNRSMQSGGARQNPNYNIVL